jgi:branched-chain amino acid transport system substrate-binding protein
MMYGARWHAVRAAAGLAIALVLAASAAEAQLCPKGTLRLYTSWPLQGEMAGEGNGMKNGVALAVAEAGGVVADYCLEVVNLDDASARTGKWDETAEADNARKAVADPQAIAFLGPYNSGAAMISARITNRASMAQITTGATYPGLTKPVTSSTGAPWTYRPLGLVNFFRPFPADDVQGKTGAVWAKQLGAKKLYIVNDGELYGRGIADIVEASAKRLGLEVVANESIDWRQADQGPLMKKIRDSGADLVYMGGVVETGAPQVVRQLHAAGLVAPQVRVIGPDGLFQQTLLRAATCDAALATELRATLPGLPFDKMTATGVKTYADYKNRFGVEPTAFALYGAEAGRVAIDAIRRAARELDGARAVEDRRDAVRRAVAGTKNFNGINGTWSFDRNGDVELSVTSGYKVVRADTAPGCRYQFETLVE